MIIPSTRRGCRLEVVFDVEILNFYYFFTILKSKIMNKFNSENPKFGRLFVLHKRHNKL